MRKQEKKVESENSRLAIFLQTRRAVTAPNRDWTNVRGTRQQVALASGTGVCESKATD